MKTNIDTVLEWVDNARGSELYAVQAKVNAAIAEARERNEKTFYGPAGKPNSPVYDNGKLVSYPPLPYPRMPRYRVGEVLGAWRTATDADLLAAGDNPEHYHPFYAQQIGRAQRPVTTGVTTTGKVFAGVLVALTLILAVCAYFGK